MNKQRQALEKALLALEIAPLDHNSVKSSFFEKRHYAIIALREALAEPEEEPICDKDPQGCWNVRCQLGKVCKNTTPPARKPLTDEEIKDCEKQSMVNGSLPFEQKLLFARAIEKAHGIGG